MPGVVIATLTTELTTDPLGLGYSGMSDQAAKVSLNANTRTEQGIVPYQRCWEWIAAGDRYKTLKAVADNTAHTANSRANALLKAIEDPEGLDFELFESILDNLVSNVTGFDTSDKNVLGNKGDLAISRATELHGYYVHIKTVHVVEARA